MFCQFMMFSSLFLNGRMSCFRFNCQYLIYNKQKSLSSRIPSCRKSVVLSQRSHYTGCVNTKTPNTCTQERAFVFIGAVNL